MLLIGRTPAASRRACIHVGDGPTITFATAPAYRGHNSGFSMTTLTSAARSTAFSAISRNFDRADCLPRHEAAEPPSPSTERYRIGRPYAVATSRAMPITDIQSGRLAVTSKSRAESTFAAATADESADTSGDEGWFASRSARSAGTGSMLSTAKPRTDIVRAISSGEAVTSTKSRSHETRIFIVIRGTA